MALSVGSCGRVGYDFSGAGVTDAAAGDAGVTDGAAGDAADTDAPADAGNDGGPSGRCPLSDVDTVSLFSVDGDMGGSVLTDAAGTLDGLVAGGVASTMAGPGGCGEALTFPIGVAGRLLDAPAWQLDDGSVDLWVRRPGSLTTFAGLVTRDATGNRAGHFAIFIGPTGRVVTRLQTGSGSGQVCSEVALAVDEWTHIGVNFGSAGLELWVNGESVQGGGTIVGPNGVTLTCGSGIAGGIAGNNNHWVIGASNASFADATDSYRDGFADGAIDHFRISRSRRDFSSYQP